MDQTLVANTIWVLLCTALVFLMQAGFCCLESGLSRSKNSINVAIKNIFDFCIGAFLFWLFGYGLIFGTSFYGLVGTDQFLFSDTTATQWPTVVFLFQMVFCGTAMTIASGVIAERMRFRAYLVLAATISGIVYPLFGHWAWSYGAEGEATGWLAQLGFIDFAGSTVVHSVGAWSAFAAALLIGPRIGRFEEGKAPREFTGSNLPMAALGLFLLWLGWFGFNGGSTLALSEEVPKIILNTVLAGSCGGLCMTVWQLRFSKSVSVPHVMNGVLAGLVGITAGCNVVSYPAALAIGTVAALVMLAATRLLENHLRIDDVVGAIAVHGFAGVWGTLAVALFAPSTMFSSGITRWNQLGIQCLGAAVCFAWSFGITYCVMKLASRWVSLRVSPSEEKMGLNVAEHGATIELFDLLTTMQENGEGNLSARASADPYTEAGMIADQYNRVLDAGDKARSELQEREVRYRSIFEHMASAVVTIDEKGRIEEFNVAAEKMFGYTCTEAMGENVCMLIPATGQENQVGCLAWGGDLEVLREIKGLRKDGTAFLMEVIVSENIIPTGIDKNSRSIFTAILSDLTERKEAEIELIRAKEAAEASDRAKSEFLTNMSHELRTPMTAILGFSDALIHSESNPETIDAATTIKRNGEHLLDLVNDILDIPKIESEKVEVRKTDCSPRAIVDDVASFMKGQAEDKSLQIEVRFEGSLPETIHTDPLRLRQILINIVGNALKFTDQGSIQIITRCLNPLDEKPKLQFKVMDTGIGIPEDRIEALFQPFTQADYSTSRMFGGTGLGLTISKRLANLLGGDISISSKVGRGSTVSITISTGPLERDRQANLKEETTVEADTKNRASSGGARLTGLRILVVEDGLDNQRLIALLLKKAEAEITLAENGQIGVDVALAAQSEGRPFDLVLMDMQMPVLDGYAATGRLRDAGFTEPIVALTAHAMTGDREKCLRAGCDEYLTKPINRKELVETIARLTQQSVVMPPSPANSSPLISDR